MKMKNKTTAGLLAIFLGGLGIHKFYLGENIAGVIYLIFCWTFIPSIIGFFEGLIILTHSDEWRDEKYNLNSKEDKTLDKMIKLDKLKESGILDNKEYKERVSELKIELKDIKEKEKIKKEKDKKFIENEKKKQGKIDNAFERVLIAFGVICLLLVVGFIGLIIYRSFE